MRLLHAIPFALALLVSVGLVVLAGCGGSSPYAQQVTGGTTSPSFPLSGGGTVTVLPGTTADFLVTVGAVQNPGALTGVTLVASGLPAGVTPSFSVNPVPIAGGDTILSLAVPASTPVGNYPFSIAGTAGSASRTVSATLVVADDLVVQVSGGGTESTSPGGSAVFPLLAQLVQFQSGSALHEVTYSTEGLPNGFTAAFSQNPVTATRAGVASNLTVGVPGGFEGGTVNFDIVAQADGNTIRLPATVMVDPAVGFDFAITGPNFFRENLNEENSYQGGVALLSGTPAPVSLTVSGIPLGMQASFSPDTVSPGDGFRLFLAADPGTLPGTYPVTITGTSGNLIRTKDFSLVIYNPDGGTDGATD